MALQLLFVSPCALHIRGGLVSIVSQLEARTHEEDWWRKALALRCVIWLILKSTMLLASLFGFSLLFKRELRPIKLKVLGGGSILNVFFKVGKLEGLKINYTLSVNLKAGHCHLYWIVLLRRICCFVSISLSGRQVGLALWLRSLVTPAEAPGLVPSTHTVAQSCL